MSEEQFYNQWLNRNNFEEVWGHIKGKFVSGYFTQTGSDYNADWRAKARTNIGLGTPAEGSIWIGGGASTPITTLATSAHGRTILLSTLSAGEIWYGVDNSTLGKVVSTALGRRLMAAAIAKDKMWYASAANTLSEVTTTPFGRGLLSAASQEVVTNLYADRAKYDLRGSEISATYGKDLAIDTSGTDAYLKLKNNAATSAFIGTGIIINKASGLVQLDSNAHIPLGLFPDSILGQLTYGGTVSAYSSATRIQIVMTASAKRIMEQRKGYAANTLDGKNIYLENLATPTTHTSSSYYFNYADCKGMYFIWTEAALATHTGEVKYRDWAGERYESGDWLTTNEEAWMKVDNTDAVTAVRGKMQSDWQTGNVELDALKVGALATYLTNTTQTVQDNVNFKKNVSVDGGVSAEGLCDLSLGGIGGGSGTVQSVQIGSGSPISPAQGSGGNVILAVETPSGNGMIKLGGTEIAVSGLAALAYKANLSLSELQNATDIQAIQNISTGTANGFLVRESDGTWSFDTSQYAASSRVSTLEGYFSSGILKSANMPVATDSALGGVKVGTSLAISSGVLNVKTGGVTNDMLAGSIANNKLAHSSISLAGRTINLGDTVTQANLRSDLGLGTAAYKADTYFAKQTDFESAVMTLSGGLGTLQSMIEDNKASIEGHDDRITDLEGYFTDGIPTGAVDAVGFANNQFTWSKGGVAQTPFTIGYATEAGKATNDKNGNDITATYLPLIGGVLKPNGGVTPLGIQPASSSAVDANIAYMNGVGTAMGYLGVQVVNNVSTPYFKATASGTAYGLIHEGNKNSLFTLFENDNEQLSATIGGENKKVTVDYASKATDIRNEDKENQSFAFRQTAGGALTYAPTSANLMRVKGNTLVWNQLLQNANFVNTDNWTGSNLSVADNVITTVINATAGTYVGINQTLAISTIEGHYYYLAGEIKTNDNSSGSLYVISGNSESGLLVSKNGVNDTFVKLSAIRQCAVSKTAISFGQSKARTGVVLQVKNVRFIDLTFFFNGNIPANYTAADFERDYGYLLANPEYNASQLINNACNAIETKDGDNEVIGRLSVNLNSFKVKDTQGNIITITGGLKKAGSVQDEIVGRKFIQRVGNVLYNGTENGWELQSINSYGIANFGIALSHKNNGGGICNIFVKQTSLISQTQDEGFLLTNGARIYFRIKSSTASTVTQFKTWLASNNVELNYELATPIEYELVDPFPTSYPVDVLGAESIVSDGLVAPFVADIRYGAKQGDILASGIPWDRLWNKPSTLAAFGITDAKIENGTVTGGEWFKVTLGDKNLYIRFVTGTGAFNLEIADNDTNPTLTKSFEFGTLTTAEINTICS